MSHLFYCLSVLYQWGNGGRKVHVGNDQKKAQSERKSHSENRGGKNQTNN